MGSSRGHQIHEHAVELGGIDVELNFDKLRRCMLMVFGIPGKGIAVSCTVV
jgi:hypothetical protein